MTDDTRSALHLAALDYVGRGWAVAPLHDVRDGLCSCQARAECKTPGKHPRGGKGWYLPDKLVTTSAAADQWYGGGHPFNVGIATGKISGFWAFDVDPLHGGDVSLAELESVFGELPPTRRHRTGSGGSHYLFTLPDDFEVWGSSGDLPRGLDVRGERGQIVAPPSRTDRGEYWVDRDGPILPPPAWLLGLIRPTPIDERPWAERMPERIDLPGRIEVAPGRIDATRLATYARSAAEGELRALAAAGVGERGRIANRTAIRLIELLNAPWSGLEPQGVWEAYLRAAEVAMQQGPPFDLGEATASWTSAARKVGTKEAAAPPDMLAVTAVNPGSPSLPSALVPPPVVSASAMSAGVEPFFLAPLAEPVHSLDDAVAALMAKMLTPAEMTKRPKPKPLIAGLLDLDTTAWMIAEPGGFKSFIALDIAARVSSGHMWQGRRTHHGPSVYIAAEGAGGMSLRVAAWEADFGPMGDVHFLPEPVQAGDPAAWAVLVEVCRRLKPSLVVIDTQARVTVGMEENSAKEMGVFIEAVEAIRRATAACVLVVHHIGRNGTAARGSSAIDGAQSTELRVVRSGKDLVCRIHQDKQKDASDAEIIELSLHRVEMGIDAETGRDLSSLVLDPIRVVSVGEADEEALREAATLDAAGKLTKTLMNHFSTGLGGTKAEILNVFVQEWGMDKATRYRAWNECLDDDVMRSFEGRSANWRYNPLDNRKKDPSFRDPFPLC